jgi:hypothetical protein
MPCAGAVVEWREMSERYKTVAVTASTVEQYRASHGNWVRVGDEVRVPLADKVDLRLFGQLRTWLFNDPPKNETND